MARLATRCSSTFSLFVASVSCGTPAQLPHAVCMSGGWRTFGHTARSLRSHVLQPWMAEPFAVIEGHALNTRQCKVLLTVDGRNHEPHCVVGTAEEIANTSPRVATVTAALNNSLAKRRIQRTVNAAPAIAPRLVMVFACYVAITAREAARGVEYVACAHIRPDLYFFQPIPAPFLAPYAPDEVRIPAGDEWHTIGSRVGFNPDLHFAGRQAFEAVSQIWRLMADPKEEEFFVPNWSSEQLWRRAYERSAAKIEKPPLAYCKISRSGACRYFGQLAQLARIDAALLRRNPQASRLLCRAAARPCANTTVRGPMCFAFCSSLGFCGESSSYRAGGTDCTGCAAESSERCPFACRRCPGGNPRDGGVARPLGSAPWPPQRKCPPRRRSFCAHFCSSFGHCGNSSAYRTDSTDCTGCDAAEAASAPSARCPSKCRRCRAGGAHDGGVGIDAPVLKPRAPYPYAWPCAGMVAQTLADAERDPGWCKLLRAVDKAGVCPLWGGEAGLARYAPYD